jgi:hypothetical protein
MASPGAAGDGAASEKGQACRRGYRGGGGRATHFETVEAVLAFIQRELARLHESRKSGEGSGQA